MLVETSVKNTFEDSRWLSQSQRRSEWAGNTGLLAQNGYTKTKKNKCVALHSLFSDLQEFSKSDL